MVDKCCQKSSKTYKKIKEFKRDLEVLSDENRLRILCLLKKHKELCVCNIFELLNLPQNLASYHLAKLRDAGFVYSKKNGANVIYAKNQKKIEKFNKNIYNLISE